MSRVQNQNQSTAGMNPTDDELDRDWKPNGRRPQSTIARSFSAELMDIFRIDNSVADLDATVHKKKEEVTKGTSELEALERRIREMEERLKRNAPGSAAAASGGSSSSHVQRRPVGDAFSHEGASAQKDVSQRASRPGTAKAQQQQPVHGGALPPTPTASEGEYELVPEPHYSNKMSSSTHTYNGSESGLETRSFTDMVLVFKDGDRDS